MEYDGEYMVKYDVNDVLGEPDGVNGSRSNHVDIQDYWSEIMKQAPIQPPLILSQLGGGVTASTLNMKSIGYQTLLIFRWMFLLFLIALNVHAQSEKDEIRWLHEGLMIDNRDVQYVLDHRDQEPQKSAWQDFQKRLEGFEPNTIVQEAEYPGAYDHVFPLLAYQMRFLENGQLPKPVISFLKNIPEMQHLMNFDRMESIWKYQKMVWHTQLIENLRTIQPLLNKVDVHWDQIRQKHQQQMKRNSSFIQGLLKTVSMGNSPNKHIAPPVKAWMSPALMASAVFEENKDLYQKGLGVFFDCSGYFNFSGEVKSNVGSYNRNTDEFDTQSFSLNGHIAMVSAMLAAAEINQRHGDLFWGDDLHHKSFGPLNLNSICSALFERIQQENAMNQVEHWGWLELAYRMYGNPDWLPVLQKHRPIFDTWVGGPATLFYGRTYPTTPPDFGTAPDGFQWLYNKKDLTGWQVSSRWYEVNEDDFYVKDGVVYTRGARDHYLYTDRMYGRFHFKVEYKIGEGSNSGVFVWAPIPGRASRTGFEIQLLDDAGQEPKENGSGSLYKVASPKVNAQVPAGEWGEIEVICNDPFITVIMNGQLIHKTNLNEHPQTEGRRRRGFIGLQDHAHKVQFRNMRIKLLDKGE